MTDTSDLDFLKRTSTIALGGGGPRIEAAVDRSRALARGASVGRYVVLDRIGGGGMGVVYSAYDPELDRKVALKLLRVELFESGEGYEARLRLLREAQALAKLAHPNVVAVHDVGTFEGQVFVAMEFVEGMTVNRWLRAEKRQWREVLGVFLQSGRGLAAAHEASLVHRDFKPSNVVVGGDGRVRVLDFGLAAPMDPALKLETESWQEGSREADLRQQSSALIAHLTQTGSTLGTPAYMAPEQHLGLGADTRSDQFSFCSALYEALYGQLPFAGGNYKEFATAVRKGQVREAPAGSGVPLWVRRVVLRGLDPDPERRFPSMQELLQALSNDPSVTRRRWLVAAGVLLAIGALVAAGVWRERQTSQLCQGADRKLAGIWDGTRKEEIRRAFLNTGEPYAALSWRQIERSLDDYTRRWVGIHTGVCEATRIRGEQSEELLDLQMACLDQRLQGLRAVSGVFREADAEVVGKAIEASGKLERLESCTNTELLKAVVKPPEDEETRRRVSAAREQIAEAKARRDAGKASEGLEIIRRVLREHGDLDYPPVLAEMNLQLAESLEWAGEFEAAEAALGDAQVSSDAGRYDELRAKVLIELVWIVGYRQLRFEVAQAARELARAVIDRLGGSGELTVRLNQAASFLEVARGELAEAERLAEIAVETAGELEGDGQQRIRSLLALSTAQLRMGKTAEALDTFREIQSFWLELAGPEHPEYAMASFNLGVALSQAGQERDSVEHLQAAVEIWEKTSGVDSEQLVPALSSLGFVLRYEEPERAFELLRRALEIQRRIHSEGHPNVAIALESIGVVHWAQRQLPEAEEYLRRSLEMKQRTWGEEHPNIISSLSNLGRLLNEQGRFAEALPLCRRSLALAERADISESLQAGDALLCAGESHLGLRDPDRAVEVLERAVEVLLPLGGSEEFLADSRFNLARALYRQGLEPERVSRLLDEARQAYLKMGASGEYPLRRLETWSKTRG